MSGWTRWWWVGSALSAATHAQITVPQPALAPAPLISGPALWILAPALLVVLLIAFTRGWKLAFASVVPAVVLYAGVFLAVRFGGPWGYATLPLTLAPLLLLGGPPREPTHEPTTTVVVVKPEKPDGAPQTG